MPITKKRKITAQTPSGEVELIIRDIDSGNVEWIGWPKTGEPLMVVQYKGGGRYAYLGVSRQKAVAASWATSSGQYINKRIKPSHEVLKLR